MVIEAANKVLETCVRMHTIIFTRYMDCFLFHGNLHTCLSELML